LKSEIPHTSEFWSLYHTSRPDVKLVSYLQTFCQQTKALVPMTQFCSSKGKTNVDLPPTTNHQPSPWKLGLQFSIRGSVESCLCKRPKISGSFWPCQGTSVLQLPLHLIEWMNSITLVQYYMLRSTTYTVSKSSFVVATVTQKNGCFFCTRKSNKKLPEASGNHTT
jgi:hypothetical protein